MGVLLLALWFGRIPSYRSRRPPLPTCADPARSRAPRPTVRAFARLRRLSALVAAVPPLILMLWGVGEAAGVEVFPRGSLFRPLLADPREAQHTLRYLVGSGNARGEVSFGDTMWLAGEEGVWQIGIQASVYTRFNRDRDSAGFLDINSADYMAMIPLDARVGRMDVRLGVGHLSSHLGESEAQRRIFFEGANFFDRDFLYRRDFLRLLVASDLGDMLRVYAGTSVGVHMTPDRAKTAVQTGVEWRSPSTSWGSLRRQWCVGIDMQTWAETDWTMNAAMDWSLRLTHPDETRGLRISLAGYTGRSLQRVLAIERERYVSIGLVFEL